MIRWLFNFVFISTALLGISQELITDSSTVRKEGIYMNFLEFKYNCPSIPMNYKISKSEIEYDKNDFHPDYPKGGHIEAYQINSKKKEVKKAYGFCQDGKIYIRHWFVSPYMFTWGKSMFVEIEYLGRYAIYSVVDVPVYQNLGGVGADGTYTAGGTYKGAPELQPKYIDMLIGESRDINVNNTYKLLKYDLSATYDFESKKPKNQYALEFMKKLSHNERGLVHNHYEIEFIETKKTEKDFLYYYKNKPDSSYIDYLKRIDDFDKSPMYLEVNIDTTYYLSKEKEIKSIKINVRHRFSSSGSSTFHPIGTHIDYHQNGQIEHIIDYDLKGRKRNRDIEYDETGKITASYIYLPPDNPFKKKE